MSAVLSTKILNEDQKRILQDAHIEVVEYNAIKIDLLDFTLPEGFDFFIFTSKNGVKSFLRHLFKMHKFNLSDISCLCVGEKTKYFLEENGLKLVKMAKNAVELANFITNYYKKEHFLIFTGNRNRPDLKRILSTENIHFEEVKVYQTSLVLQQFKDEFKSVLFFSPSGVESYTRKNDLGHTPVFCIGDTTAKEARKYSTQVLIAEKPTVESVIELLIKTYPTLTKQ